MPDSAGRRFPLGRRLRRAVFASPVYNLMLGRARPRELALVPPDPWPGDLERGAAMLAGVYRFAGELLEAAEPSFDPPDLGEDFVAEINGFDWLRHLRALGGDAARRHARRLVLAWVERHDHWHPLLWRPDVLGTRIAAWVGAHDFFCASADDDFRQRVFASLARQVRHLANSAPGERPGPPRIAAARGLVHGALALGEGERLVPRGLRLLERELERQVLPDGGHVSRNPVAQVAVLRHLIDLRAALHAAGNGVAADEPVPEPEPEPEPEPTAEPVSGADPGAAAGAARGNAAAAGPYVVPEALRAAIERMAPVLRLLRHDDHGLALFHGSQEGEPALIDAVLTQSGVAARPAKGVRYAGYERVMAGRTLVLLDAGPPPSSGFDRDAHAAPLSFELSVARERLIVNCGAWPGRTGRGGAAWHAALRQTAAHSTLTVGDTAVLPLRADGGLARRSGSVTAERSALEGGMLIEAAHDYYVKPFGVVHRRRLWVADTGDDIRGEDAVTPVAGRTSRPVPFALRFHLHPAPEVDGAAAGAVIRTASGATWRFVAEGGTVGLEESVYVGHEAARRRGRQIVVSGTAGGDGEVVVKWALQREHGSAPVTAPEDAGGAGEGAGEDADDGSPVG